MTTEQAIGVVAAVYRTPLPMLMEMPLCSILSWLSDVPVVLPIIEPLAGGSKQEKITSPAQLMQLAQLTGLPVIGG